MFLRTKASIDELNKKSNLRLAGGVGVVGAGFLGQVGAGAALTHQMKRIDADKADKDASDKLAADILKKTGARTYKDQKDDLTSYYHPGKNEIHTGRKSVAIQSHESGHAYNSTNGKVKGTKRSIAYGLSNMMVSAAGVNALGNPVLAAANPIHIGSAVSGMIRAENDKNGKKTNALIRYSPEIITAIAASPMLYEEFRASQRGMKMLKELRKNDPKAEEKNRRDRRLLRKAFMTYGSAALGAAGSARMAAEAAYQARLK